jgi:hypothetical protein
MGLKTKTAGSRYALAIRRLRFFRPFLLTRRDGALLLLLSLCGAMGCDSCGSKAPVDWVANVESASNQTRLSEGKGAPLIPAMKGHYLRIGGRLETGPSGGAILTLRNGGKLTVLPNSVVLFTSNLPGNKINLTLTAGALIGQGPELQGGELVIEAGQRKVHLLGAAIANISAPSQAGKEPGVRVTFGEATVEGPDGDTQTLLSGSELVIRPKPDAGPVETITASEVIFYLQSTGKGRVLIKQPDENKFSLVSRGEVLKIVPDTHLKLLPQATVIVGAEKGKGTLVNGPAEVIVKEAPPDSPGGMPNVQLVNIGGAIHLLDEGKRGKNGESLEIDGVTVSTRITYRRLDVQVLKDQDRHLIKVKAGEATLKGKGKTVRLEAGQDAVIRRGDISGPHVLPASPLEVNREGTIRFFVSDAQVPVSFRFKHVEGNSESLVEVSRGPAGKQPIFADVIRRNVLTLPKVSQGSVFWRVNGEDGKQGIGGRLVLVKDTSFRALVDRKPRRNTIDQNDGDTLVYFQNNLPRFTFHWDPIEGASVYQLKIYREQQLTQPLVKIETKTDSTVLPPGKVGEGTYLWYVAGRDSDGKLIKTSQSRKLSIHYDNATPDLQIIYPRNAISVSQPTIEVKGVAIPGSKVFINDEGVQLDGTSRFAHTVNLHPGPNFIIFSVVDPRQGASYYMRLVTKK